MANPNPGNWAQVRSSKLSTRELEFASTRFTATLNIKITLKFGAELQMDTSGPDHDENKNGR